MITLSILFLFGIGAFVLAVGAGVIGATFKIFGHVLSAGLSLLGFLLMPLAIVLAIAYGIGFLLPFLIPAGIVLLIIAMIGTPMRA